LGFGIWDLGFGIWDLGFGIWDLGKWFHAVSAKAKAENLKVSTVCVNGRVLLIRDPKSQIRNGTCPTPASKSIYTPKPIQINNFQCSARVPRWDRRFANPLLINNFHCPTFVPFRDKMGQEITQNLLFRKNRRAVS
jgi:hypothetical protein